jgi:cyclic beta-1,2-glucan synthetase
VNVIANESFGCLVSESGATTTWSQNSREHRLTPWANDPVLDPHGEALYVRDEDSGAFWSPLPGPAPAGEYEVRHGFGWTRFIHRSHELDHETRVFVARYDPIRFVQLRLTNRATRRRRLSLFAYQRLVLGTTPEQSGRFIHTSHDRMAGALFARNPMAGEFADRVAFAASLAPVADAFVSGDRASFLGEGGVANPHVVASGATLDGRTGEGLDPCFASQSVVEIPPGGSLDATFVLGEGEGESQIRAWLAQYREPNAVARALREVTDFWDDLVSAIHVTSPSPAIDLMVNGWLAYQALSCRMWGRTAFYQSGGAFGYRDQLQDASAFAALHPDLLRTQIVLHAGHQFVEGDVLHWWHPPLDRGIRTRFADDLLWLPYLTAGYVQTTGDWSLLEERAPFLASPPLAEGEDETFLTPQVSGETASIFEHCCRAIDRALAVGAHGLPLFGSGDWNDGMNRVGREGRGESVWMGFFLHAVLGDFAPVCERQGDRTRARRYREHREHLREALNGAGWDGKWYRRGYYDDGAPLGSHASDECRIDALAQAWSVISGAAPRERAVQALGEVQRQLVSDDIVRLLTPPFENTPHDPGYIKGYVRGVRENGGQYTHAALWVVKALAELGLAERAAPMLEMLSPIRHSETQDQVATYRVEPYVIAADVYGEPPHVGRGGWTWYTGSAAWMLRVALESVFGVRMVGGDTLVLRPCIPAAWPELLIQWRVPGDRTRYDIHVKNAGGASLVRRALLDGEEVEVVGGAARVPLLRDGGTHRIDVELGGAEPAHDGARHASHEEVRVEGGARSGHGRPAPEPGR